MKKIFTFFLVLVTSMGIVYASDTQVDGIWYNFDSSTKTASVTYRGDNDSSYKNEYTGNVVIPSSVTYNGTTYSVTSIGSVAFCGCSSLTSVTIPNSVTRIGSDAFYGCSSLLSVTINSDAIVSKKYSDASNISHIFGSQVTEYIIGDDVNSIGEWAFYGCSSLLSVTILNSVTSIGSYAFNGCSSLTSVTIPNSVTSIGSWAFEDCSKLTKTNYTGDIAGWCNIKFGSYDANPMYYSRNFYINDQEIKDLVIPNSVTSIGSYAFNGCSSLLSVTIPNSVMSIGSYAFNGCSGLTSVTINSDAIVSKKYSDASNISHIFGSQVTEYIIGDDVNSIGSSAFYDCSSLLSVTIPNSVTSIGSDAFNGCSSLTSVTISESVTSIGNYAFCWCSSLTSVTIPNSVTSIGKAVFSRCSSLSSVTIPNSVTSIGGSAFYYCSKLISVTIGESVTSIGDAAFMGCDRLYDIYCHAELPPFSEESSFSNYNAYVHVPCESLRYYKADMVWCKFPYIVCLSEEETDIENINTSSLTPTNCQKILRDGQLIILRDGKTYNAIGQEM